MTDIERELNAMLKLQPIPPIKGEKGGDAIIKQQIRADLKPLPPAKVVKIKKIDTDSTQSAENGFEAISKDLPNTLDKKYVRIGNTMIPGSYFTPKQEKVADPVRAAAARINMIIPKLKDEDTKAEDADKKFDRLISKQNKDKYEFIVDDFNQYMKSISIGFDPKAGGDKETKMAALLRMLNSTQGNINIVDPSSIDSVLLIEFNDYTRKTLREINYVQPRRQIADYVRKNGLMSRLKVHFTRDINYSYFFTYIDASTTPDEALFNALVPIFHNFTRANNTSEKQVLIASMRDLGSNEDDFYKNMGRVNFMNHVWPHLAPSLGLNPFLPEEEVAGEDNPGIDFYNRIFTITPVEQTVRIENDFKEEIRDSNREMRELLDRIAGYNYDLNVMTATQNSMLERGERLKARAVEQDIRELREIVEPLIERVNELRTENEDLKRRNGTQLQRINIMENDNADLFTEQQRLREQIDKLKRKKKKNERNRADKTARLEYLVNQINQNISNLTEATLKKYRSEIQKLRAELAASESEKEELHAQISDLEERAAPSSEPTSFTSPRPPPPPPPPPPLPPREEKLVTRADAANVSPAVRLQDLTHRRELITSLEEKTREPAVLKLLREIRGSTGNLDIPDYQQFYVSLSRRIQELPNGLRDKPEDLAARQSILADIRDHYVMTFFLYIKGNWSLNHDPTSLQRVYETFKTLGGSLNLREMRALHSVIFIKSIKKINTGIYLFQF